jgi:SAM-dependent methyltransferase
VLATLKRSVRDGVARLGLADSAFWLYGVASKANPSSIVGNARYRRLGAPDQLPIPPPHLIFLVAGTADISWFMTGGALAAASITETLSARGVSIEKVGSILDFGCGCGRVLRNWHSLSGTRVSGVDYNSGLIDWCRVNLPFADFRINQLAPPLAYSDAEFDLAYALSVFTHLTEELQVSWIEELSRVVKPGGHLVISTHGEPYLHRLNDRERSQFASGHLVVKNNTKAPGSNTCSAYHPPAYVRNVLARGLEVIDFIPEGAKGNPRQDLYLLRKLSHATPRA